MGYLNGEACPKCGKETVYWQAHNETEKKWELYMDCDEEHDDGCGLEFSKVLVNKSEDCTHSAFEQRLKQKLAAHRGSGQF